MLRADWEFSQDKASITGPLSRGTVMALWDEWQQKSTHPKYCLIDLSKIERIDSAGMVMLIHLIEFEKKHNCHVEVSGVPRQLVTLLELSNIANIYQEHVADDISEFLKEVKVDSTQVQQLLQDALNLQEIHVKGEGSHYEVIAVDAQFDGMSRVKKQQFIYAPLMEYIQRNDIHAVSIKAFTPEEWARDKKLMSL